MGCRPASVRPSVRPSVRLAVRPSVVTKCISELLARIIPKVGQEVGWPSTPGRFFRIFDFGDFGHLAGVFWSKLVNLGRFSTSNVIFLKKCSVTFFLIAHGDAN